MRSARADEVMDLYVQLILKQGQVEIEGHPADISPSQYRNTGVELIHRREVENLNKSIIVRISSINVQSIKDSFFL